MLPKPIIEEIKEDKEQINSPKFNTSYFDIETVTKKEKFSFKKLLNNVTQPIFSVINYISSNKLIENKLISITHLGFNIALFSMLLNYFHLFSYQQQLQGISTSKFSGLALMINGIYCLCTIIIEVIKSAYQGQYLGKKFDSAWLPISTAITAMFFIPIDVNGMSLFSSYVKMIVSYIATF